MPEPRKEQILLFQWKRRDTQRNIKCEGCRKIEKKEREAHNTTLTMAETVSGKGFTKEPHIGTRETLYLNSQCIISPRITRRMDLLTWSINCFSVRTDARMALRTCSQRRREIEDEYTALRCQLLQPNTEQEAASEAYLEFLLFPKICA